MPMRSSLVVEEIQWRIGVFKTDRTHCPKKSGTSAPKSRRNSVLCRNDHGKVAKDNNNGQPKFQSDILLWCAVVLHYKIVPNVRYQNLRVFRNLLTSFERLKVLVVQQTKISICSWPNCKRSRPVLTGDHRLGWSFKNLFGFYPLSWLIVDTADRDKFRNMHSRRYTSV